VPLPPHIILWVFIHHIWFWVF